MRPFHSSKIPRWLRNLPAGALVLALAAIVSIVPVVRGRVLESQDPAPATAAKPAQSAKISDKTESQQTVQQSADAVTAGPEKQAAEESARLLKLAADLKAEVDKTTKDTLSLTVIRKADEIERLARSVREKAKLSAEAK
ncbi:MAG: hypothetical protein ABR956_00585 [Terracidiphilus sp.]|jgi:hypothetical protein